MERLWYGTSASRCVRGGARYLLDFAPSLADLRIGNQRAISAFTKLSNLAGARSPLMGPSRRDRSDAS